MTCAETIAAAAELGDRARRAGPRVVAARDSPDRGGDADAAGSVRPRRPVRRVQRAVPHERVARRPQRQPRPVRPGVPARLRAHLRRRGSRPGRREVSAQPAGSRGDRARARAGRGRRRIAQDRGTAQIAGIRRGDRRPISSSDRRGGARPAGAAVGRATPGDGAHVFARPVAGLARRERPQTARAGAVERKARHARGPSVGNRTATGCRRSSTSRWPRATASCWRAIARAAPKRAAASTRCSATGRRASGRRRAASSCCSRRACSTAPPCGAGQADLADRRPAAHQAAAGDVLKRPIPCGAWRSTSRARGGGRAAHGAARRRPTARASTIASDHVPEAARKHAGERGAARASSFLDSAARRTSCASCRRTSSAGRWFR